MYDVELSKRLRERALKRRREEALRREKATADIDSKLADYPAPQAPLTGEQEQAVRRLWGGIAFGRFSDWVAMYAGVYGEFDARFVPDSVYYVDMDAYYNLRMAAEVVDHKCYYGRLFPEIRQPRVLACRINNRWLNEKFDSLSLAEVEALCKNCGKVIIKPALYGCAGQGINVWEEGEETDKAMERLHRILARPGVDLVIQAYLVQDEILEELHPQSVNTVRVLSFYRPDGIVCLSSVLRVGQGESVVDNISAGGISIGIQEDGRLKTRGFDKSGHCQSMLKNGRSFAGIKIPAYGEMLERVVYMHRHLPYFRLVSWDFAVDADHQPVMIEMNLRNGELDFHQMNNGPLFGTWTEEVIEELRLKLSI